MHVNKSDWKEIFQGAMHPFSNSNRLSKIVNTVWLMVLVLIKPAKKRAAKGATQEGVCAYREGY